MKPRAPGQSLEIKPTLVDRLINYFNPESGLARLKARAHTAAIGGYSGGRKDRRMIRRWRPQDQSPDAAILPDLADLRSRSDDLARNTPIATGAIATTVTNTVGTGLKLQASIDALALGISEDQADAMKREQEREWSLFCQTCDFSAVQSFAELQPTALRAVLQQGDLLLVRRFRRDAGDIYGTKLQMVAASRLSNPDNGADTDRQVAGVEYNSDGVPIAYHISDKHPGAPGVGALKWQRLPARSARGKQLLIHLFDRQLPDQTRGVPYLAPVIEHLKTLGEYSEAEVSAAVISAYFTVFIKNSDDSDETPSVGERDSADDLETNETKLGKGAIINLGDNEEAQFADPSRPNANFDPFVQAILREIGVALELPLELLIKHFTASYSASRAALEMGWQFFRKQRAWLSRRLCQVVYEWMVDEAVASGRLARPGYFEDPILRRAYLGAEWIGPSRISLDPLKEANADKVDVLELHVKTREQVCMERTGGEIERKLPQLGRERMMIDKERLAPAARQAPGQTPGQAAPGQTDDDDTGDDETKQNEARA